MQPIIKWTGSKRKQVKQIMSFIDFNFDTYYEPFVGGASMLYFMNPLKAICSDINESLIELWNIVKDNPNKLFEEYETRWKKLEQDKDFYYETRRLYNQNKNCFDFFFLTRTCVNGLIRFNSNGEFNSSLHPKRNGISPNKLRNILNDWHKKIKNYEFLCRDYKEILSTVTNKDLVYLDPPYFHTSGMYFGNINFDEFCNFLEALNKKDVKFALSLDGTRGEHDFTINLPKELYKRHEMIDAGICGFNKIQGKGHNKVFDSLYMNF